ncbi:haloacid dehalogenase [Clostridia bacterium]|nr:haloacid dehalogenase [Clostridia bacterium]
MKPDFFVKSVRELTPEFLKSRGISALMLDLDNTLAGYRADAPSPEIAAWLESVRAAGFALRVVSNSGEGRVRRFCEPLGLEYVHSAKKPSPDGLLKALETLKNAAMVGDQLFTDVRSGIRAGVPTIMVDPLNNGFVFKARRAFEKLIMGRERYEQS